MAVRARAIGQRRYNYFRSFNLTVQYGLLSTPLQGLTNHARAILERVRLRASPTALAWKRKSSHSPHCLLEMHLGLNRGKRRFMRIVACLLRSHPPLFVHFFPALWFACFCSLNRDDFYLTIDLQDQLNRSHELCQRMMHVKPSMSIFVSWKLVTFIIVDKILAEDKEDRKFVKMRGKLKEKELLIIQFLNSWNEVKL